jgi:hypothetical protein
MVHSDVHAWKSTHRVQHIAMSLGGDISNSCQLLNLKVSALVGQCIGVT